LDPNTAKKIRALEAMTIGELRDKYLEVFGEATRSGNKRFLVRRIAWQLQALREGGLSERARRRAAELADESHLRTRAPGMPSSSAAPDRDPARTVIRSFSPPHNPRLPMPGTILTREYRGKTIQVMVLDKGFEFEGQLYRSLTAIAEAVTGSHWNGRQFFGIKKNGIKG
jgi:hypothetical protein